VSDLDGQCDPRCVLRSPAVPPPALQKTLSGMKWMIPAPAALVMALPVQASPHEAAPNRAAVMVLSDTRCNPDAQGVSHCLNLDPPFCPGVASRPARQAAPRPGWASFLPCRVVPPGRCAPRGEGIIQAPGLHNPFPARPDDPDERLAITQNGGSRLNSQRYRRHGRT
jgi:hypothetical protein